MLLNVPEYMPAHAQQYPGVTSQKLTPLLKLFFTQVKDKRFSPRLVYEFIYLSNREQMCTLYSTVTTLKIPL